MKMKKFLRGPWLWIGLALGVMLIGSQLMTTQQFTKVDTQVGLELIETGKAKTVKIFDGSLLHKTIILHFGWFYTAGIQSPLHHLIYFFETVKG